MADRYQEFVDTNTEVFSLLYSSRVAKMHAHVGLIKPFIVSEYHVRTKVLAVKLFCRNCHPYKPVSKKQV